MPARSKARKRALDILYAAELRGQDAVETLEVAVAEGDGPTNPYTETLVRGVTEHRARIDELLAQYAQGWSLDRMPAVDRTALRLGTFELLFVDDVPDAVAVSEAVALVRNLSTDDSPSYVNGVLGSMMRDRDTLVG
jgi:N utilization substance protein B